MKAAVDGMKTDPRQALRSLQAQAEELEMAAVAECDWTAASSAKLFKDYLSSAIAKGRFSTAQVTHRATDLLSSSSAKTGTA